MNITVNVDEVTLDTVVAQVYGYDEDGYSGKQSTGTIADLVAAKIVEKVSADETRYTPLLVHIRNIRTELIREMVRPQIEQALSEPFSRVQPRTLSDAPQGGNPIHPVRLDGRVPVLDDRLDRLAATRQGTGARRLALRCSRRCRRMHDPGGWRGAALVCGPGFVAACFRCGVTDHASRAASSPARTQRGGC